MLPGWRNRQTLGLSQVPAEGEKTELNQIQCQLKSADNSILFRIIGVFRFAQLCLYLLH